MSEAYQEAKKNLDDAKNISELSNLLYELGLERIFMFEADDLYDLEITIKTPESTYKTSWKDRNERLSEITTEY